MCFEGQVDLSEIYVLTYPSFARHWSWTCPCVEDYRALQKYEKEKFEEMIHQVSVGNYKMCSVERQQSNESVSEQAVSQRKVV